MISCRLAQEDDNQRGFTLVELVMVLGVVAIIVSAITMAIFQVIDINARHSAHMTAVKEVENVVHWITRDVEMAQFSEDAGPVSLHSFAAHPPLILAWVNKYDGTSGTVTYSQNGGQLQRTYSASGAAPVTNTIAHSVDFSPQNTNWSFSGGDSGSVLSFKITSAVSGLRRSSETRSFEVVPRSTPLE